MQSSQIKWKLEVELFNIKLAALFPLFLHRRCSKNLVVHRNGNDYLHKDISQGAIQCSLDFNLTNPFLAQEPPKQMTNANGFERNFKRFKGNLHTCECALWAKLPSEKYKRD